MLDTQHYLKTRSIEDLIAQYKITVRQHSIYPSLHLFKYGIDSPMGETITQECRGLILDRDDDWRVVSYPFRKFFNLHEGHAAPITWERAEVMDKMDGSLCILYNYHDTWFVSTTGMPDAQGTVSSLSTQTFADLFWRTFDKSRLPDPDFCYMFELTSPYNRIVVPYKETSLTFLGARHIKTLKETGLDLGLEYDWNVVRSFDLGGLDGILEASKELDPMVSEGYVVCDNQFNRVKIKGPRYVAMHHLRNQFTYKNIVDAIRKGETSEVLTYFPEFSKEFQEALVKYEKLIHEIDLTYTTLKCIEEQKYFAMMVSHLPYAGILFMIKKGVALDARDALQKVKFKTLIGLLEAK